MDFKCMKCGSEEYQVKTTIIPEKSEGLKLELGAYYLKICLHCGYTELYSAKVVNKDRDEKPCTDF